MSFFFSAESILVIACVCVSWREILGELILNYLPKNALLKYVSNQLGNVFVHNGTTRSKCTTRSDFAVVLSFLPGFYCYRHCSSRRRAHGIVPLEGMEKLYGAAIHYHCIAVVFLPRLGFFGECSNRQRHLTEVKTYFRIVIHLALCSEPISGRGCDEALSVKKWVFQWKGGRQFSEWGTWQGFLKEGQVSEEVRAIQWAARLWKLKSCCPHPLPKNQRLYVLCDS